jgi:hypothetical protein
MQIGFKDFIAVVGANKATNNSLHGNRITALRWQDFLEKLGIASPN